jgi:hypothetical protein
MAPDYGGVLHPSTASPARDPVPPRSIPCVSDRPRSVTPLSSGWAAQRGSNSVTSSGSAVNGLAHSDGAPVIGWASVTTVNGRPG